MKERQSFYGFFSVISVCSVAKNSVAKKKAFTLVELLVVIAIIALLMGVLLPAISRAREQAKRIVCLSDIKQLTIAWGMYADTNNDKMVNTATPSEGSAECDQCPDCPTGDPYIAKAKAPTDAANLHYKEMPWVGGAFYSYTQPLPEKAARCAIQTGALFKYAPDFKLYRCPTANKGEFFTYNAMASMNGGNTGKAPFKNRNEIRHTAKQLVLCDEGQVSPNILAVEYTVEQWWDPPEVRHGDGQVFSFADNHAEYWKWSKESADLGLRYISGTYNPSSMRYHPTTSAGKQDLYKVQYGCWGSLGYTPSIPPAVN
jgi:prepilin-type N-terminal cleavage/methylation domain-containing protein